MYKFDYHMHTNYSTDCNEKIENVINAAIKKGFDEIAITDHFDFDNKGNLIVGNYDYHEYFKVLLECRDKFKDKIIIKVGIEIGVAPYLEKEVPKLLHSDMFDFIIASSHYTSGIDLYTGEYFVNRQKYEAYLEYFNEIYENVKIFDDFSVYGHFDYIARYGEYRDNTVYYDEFKEIIDKIILELISKGKGFEVNTSGIRYQLNTIHPQLPILKRYKELGGEILTIGSDAHRTIDIGADFDFAYDVIKEAGFKYLTTFTKRKPSFIEI